MLLVGIGGMFASVFFFFYVIIISEFIPFIRQKAVISQANNGSIPTNFIQFFESFLVSIHCFNHQLITSFPKQFLFFLLFSYQCISHFQVEKMSGGEENVLWMGLARVCC